MYTLLQTYQKYIYIKHYRKIGIVLVCEISGDGQMGQHHMAVWGRMEIDASAVATAVITQMDTHTLAHGHTDSLVRYCSISACG